MSERGAWRRQRPARTNTGEPYITRQVSYVVSRRATGVPYVCRRFKRLEDAIRYRDEMIGRNDGIC